MMEHFAYQTKPYHRRDELVEIPPYAQRVSGSQRVTKSENFDCESPGRCSGIQRGGIKIVADEFMMVRALR